MSTSTAAPTSPPTSIAGTVVRWVLRAALALVFLGAGAAKLAGEAALVQMFDDVGAGQGLRLFVGAAEVAGAVGLLVPRLHRAAAAGLALLMLGATVVNLTVLDATPLPAVVLMLLALVVASTGRRRRPAAGTGHRAAPGRAPRSSRGQSARSRTS